MQMSWRANTKQNIVYSVRKILTKRKSETKHKDFFNLGGSKTLTMTSNKQKVTTIFYSGKFGHSLLTTSVCMSRNMEFKFAYL